MAAHTNEKKEKIASIGVYVLLLVCMLAAVFVGTRSYHHPEWHSHKKSHPDDDKDIATSGKAIQSICKPTNYEDICIKSLNSTSSKSHDVRALVELAFNVTKEEITKALHKSSTIKAAEDDPRSAQGLEICKELMEHSLNDLERSIESVVNFDMTNKFEITKKLDIAIENLQVWVSGALTYQETCLDAFENSTGHTGRKMKELLITSKELTSNALTIISELNAFAKTLDVSSIINNQKSDGEQDDSESSNNESSGEQDQSNAHRRLLSSPGLSNASPSQSLPKASDLPAWLNDKRRHIMEIPISEIHPDAVVAKDGSGTHKTIMEAVNVVPKNNEKTFVIHIKEGVYQEYVVIDQTKTSVVFIGDGATKTKITGNKNFVDGIQTFKTATVDVVGDGFMARGISFENTAGPTKHQAVAVRVVADFSIFYNCRFDGYQDTLYAVRSRQFYRDCTISGTIDFIFGDALAIFQNCKMVIRKPLEGQGCMVTAQGRTQADGPGATVLQNCTITAQPDYYPVKATNRAFLGRPWKAYSRTIVMQSYIDEAIDPEGWTPWMGNFGLHTLYYVEYENRGPGSVRQKRVTWAGIKKLSAVQVEDFTPAKFFADGGSWISSTGVPFYPGMVAV